MDISKFKIHDWLMVGGGAGMLIFGLFGWVSGAGASANAFDFFLTGTIPWLLLVATGVLAFLIAADIIKRDSAPWPTILLGLATVGALLVVIRLLIGPRISAGGFTFTFTRGFGLYLSAIAGVVAAVGAFMNFTASGGNLAELGKSMQSKVSSGSSRSNDAPPPPPPSDAPPPPPPPSN